MVNSLKQLIKEVEDLSNSHGQIKSFHYGETLRIIQSQEIDYTSCFMNISRTGMNRNSTDISIELLVIDRVKDDDDKNRLDSENITLRVIRDLINTIGYSTRWRLFSDLLTQSPTQKFYDHLKSKVTGHSVTITLQMYNNDGICDLPIFDYDFNQPIPIDECDVLVIAENSDGTQLATKIVNDNDNIILIPNINFTDSDGTTTSVASGVDLVCTPVTPIVDSLKWTLNYDDGDYRINVLCTNENKGQLTSFVYNNIGTLTYSDDNGVTFQPFTAPLTLVLGTTYIFERSITSGIGDAVFSGIADAEFTFTGSYESSLIQHLIGGVGVVGSVWKDQTFNGNDATLVNSPVVNGTNVRLQKANQQWINLNHGASLNEFTISLTIEYLTLTNQDRLLNQITNVGGTWSMYAVNNAFSGNRRMEFYTNPSWHDTNFEPFINNKYIIDITVNNTTNDINIYVDSVLFKTINDNVMYTDLGIGNLYRGVFGNYLDARIYDFKHFNKALTQLEINDKNS